MGSTVDAAASTASTSTQGVAATGIHLSDIARAVAHIGFILLPLPVSVTQLVYLLK